MMVSANLLPVHGVYWPSHH